MTCVPSAQVVLFQLLPHDRKFAVPIYSFQVGLQATDTESPLLMGTKSAGLLSYCLRLHFVHYPQFHSEQTAGQWLCQCSLHDSLYTKTSQHFESIKHVSSFHCCDVLQ